MFCVTLLLVANVAGGVRPDVDSFGWKLGVRTAALRNDVLLVTRLETGLKNTVQLYWHYSDD